MAYLVVLERCTILILSCGLVGSPALDGVCCSSEASVGVKVRVRIRVTIRVRLRVRLTGRGSL